MNTLTTILMNAKNFVQNFFQNPRPVTQAGLDLNELIALGAEAAMQGSMKIGDHIEIPDILIIEVAQQKSARIMRHREMIEQRLPTLINQKLSAEHNIQQPQLKSKLIPAEGDLHQDYKISSDFSPSPTTDVPKPPSPSVLRAQPHLLPKTPDISEMQTRKGRSAGVINLSWLDDGGSRSCPIFGEVTFGRAEEHGRNKAEILANSSKSETLSLLALRMRPTPNGVRLENLGDKQLIISTPKGKARIFQGKANEFELPLNVAWPGKNDTEGFVLNLQTYKMEN